MSRRTPAMIHDRFQVGWETMAGVVLIRAALRETDGARWLSWTRLPTPECFCLLEIPTGEILSREEEDLGARQVVSQ